MPEIKIFADRRIIISTTRQPLLNFHDYEAIVTGLHLAHSGPSCAFPVLSHIYSNHRSWIELFLFITYNIYVLIYFRLHVRVPSVLHIYRLPNTIIRTPKAQISNILGDISKWILHEGVGSYLNIEPPPSAVEVISKPNYSSPITRVPMPDVEKLGRGIYIGS